MKSRHGLQNGKRFSAGRSDNKVEFFMQKKNSELEPYIQVLPQCFISHSEAVGEYGGVVEHLGRCELNTFVAQN